MSRPFVDQLDSESVAIYLEVPGSSVVMFQAILESYDGIGVVRTLSIRDSLICILTTPSMVDSLLDLLHSVRDNLPWRALDHRPPQAHQELFLGYFRKRNDAESGSQT